MRAELHGRGKAHRGRRFAIFIRPTEGAEETGTLSALKAFLSIGSPVRPSVVVCWAPQAAARARGELALPGAAQEGSLRKWCCSAFLAMPSPRRPDCNVLYSLLLNAVCVKRLLRVGCSGLSLNTSLKEKLKQQMNKMVVVWLVPWTLFFFLNTVLEGKGNPITIEFEASRLSFIWLRCVIHLDRLLFNF